MSMSSLNSSSQRPVNRKTKTVLAAVIVCALAVIVIVWYMHFTGTEQAQPGSISNSKHVKQENKPGKQQKTTDSSVNKHAAEAATVKTVIDAVKPYVKQCKVNPSDKVCKELADKHFGGDTLAFSGFTSPVAMGFRFDVKQSMIGLSGSENASGKRVEVKMKLPDADTVGYTAVIRVTGSDSMRVIKQEFTQEGIDWSDNHPEARKGWMQ